MNSKEFPIVSIIMPSYNSAPFISASIESVLKQTFHDWELIIVDDCSSDDTNKIIEKYINKKIKLIKLDKNSGAAIARNTAIKVARGRYIAFLDSDDLWEKEKLSTQLEFMRKNSVPFSCTAYKRVSEKSEKVIDTLSVPFKVKYTDIIKHNTIGCLSVIYDTKKLGKVYMPNISKRQDFGLWLKLLKITPYVYGLNIPLARYRVRSNSVSSNKLLASIYQWKIYRDVEKLPLYKAVYYFAWYTCGHIFKYGKILLKVNYEKFRNNR